MTCEKSLVNVALEAFAIGKIETSLSMVHPLLLGFGNYKCCAQYCQATFDKLAGIPLASKAPPPGATSVRSRLRKICRVVATAADITGKPDARSIISIDGKDGICTHAEATIASTPRRSSLRHSSAGAVGS